MTKQFPHLRFGVITTLLSLVVHVAVSQNYVSSGAGSGDWDDPLSWTPNGVPTSASGTVTIQNGHTIQIVNDVTIDEVTIAAGGTLNIDPNVNFLTVNVTLNNGPGDDLIVNGTLNLFDDGFTEGGNLSVSSSGSIVVNGTGSLTINDPFLSFLTFNASSTYQHNRNGGVVPPATWNVSSNCIITGITSTAPTGLSQSFGNFTLSNAGQTLPVVYLGLTSSSSFGSFTISNTSTRVVALTQSTNATVNVQNDFSVSGTSRFGLTNSGTVTLVVNRDFSYTSTGSSNLSGTGGTANIQVKRNLILSSGTIGKSGGGAATFLLNGSAPTVQNFTSGSTINSNINFTVNNGAIFNLGTSALSGANAIFNLQSGGTIQVGSPNGLATGTNGNIQVGGARNYSAGGNIVYNGVTQDLGDEWSSLGALNGIAVNLELANGTVVTNNNIGNTSLVGVLTMTNGRFNIGNSNTLNIQGVFNSTASGFIGGSTTSNLTFSGSGALGTLNMASGATSLNNLTVSRTGTLVLGSSLTVEGTIDLSFGNLNFSGRTLTMNGGSIVTAGTGLISNSTSNLIFGGSTFSGTIPFQGAGNQLNDLTFSTPGGAFTWNSPVTINNNVTLTAGTVTHNSGLTMGTGSTFIRSGGSLTTNDPDVVTSYNVTYTGSVTTGLELPGSATELNTLTINSSGSVTLDKDITVNGNVNLQGSTLIAGTRNITLAGATGNWNRTSGSFSGGTGVVTVAGNYTIVAPGVTPSFTNITVNSTRTLTLPTGNINIGGNLVNNGTIAPSTSTAIFNGTTTISGSSATSLNNVTVTGTLTAPSATTLNLAGNWTNNGTFNNNNGAVNFNGTTTIAGSSQSNFFTVTVSGTLTAPTSLLGIAGNFTNNGTFNNNGGTVVFNGTVVAQTVSGSATTFNNVTVSNPVTPGVQIANTSRLNGTLTLTSGAFMDADGPSGTGVFIVSSTSQTVGGRIAALPNPTNLTGQVTIERYIHGKTGGDYRYLSMPITTNANLSIWRNSIHVTGNFSDRSTNADNSNIVDSGNTNPSVFTYNSTTQTFTAVNGSGGLTSATGISSRLGYSAYDFNNGAVTVSYRGIPEQGNVPITISNANGNFNLVPNPYPSPLDWDNVVKTNVNDAMYLRVDNNVFSSYVGGVATNAPFGGWTGEISTGQAFWVVSNGGGTTFTMREADKTGNNNYFLRTKSPDDYFRISLNAETGRSDEIVIRFADNASDGFDPEWDAFKLKNDQLKSPTSIETTPSFNLSSYVNNPMEEYAINSVAKLTGEKIINLNIADVEPGEYVLKFSDLALLSSGYRVVLVDLYGRKETDITDGSEYVFQITEEKQSTGMGRFYLRINGEPAKDFPPYLTELQVYPNPTTDYVYIELSEVERNNLKSITLLNAMGANLSQENFDSAIRPSGKQVLDLRERPAGLYLIAIQLGEQKKVIRVLKR